MRSVYRYLDVSMDTVRPRLLNAYAKMNTVGKVHIAMNVSVNMSFLESFVLSSLFLIL